MLNKNREDEVIALCRKLVQAKSYSGEEGQVAKELSLFFKEKGFDDVTVDTYGNIIGRIKGKYPGKKIVFDGHMDTVPVGNEADWSYSPFGGEIHDGRIYGRGTSDMKGAVAAMACAAANFAEDNDREFAGEVYIAGVVHEECFEGIAARSISAAVKPDYVIIGEASGLNLKIGQRGRAEIKIETFGVPAHSANPEKGVNAVYKMSKVIDAVRTLEPTSHPVLGRGILELTDIKSSPYPGASVVPEYCAATYDRRLLVGETKISVLKPIEELLDRCCTIHIIHFEREISYREGVTECYQIDELSSIIFNEVHRPYRHIAAILAMPVERIDEEF